MPLRTGEHRANVIPEPAPPRPLQSSRWRDRRSKAPRGTTRRSGRTASTADARPLPLRVAQPRPRPRAPRRSPASRLQAYCRPPAPHRHVNPRLQPPFRGSSRSRMTRGGPVQQVLSFPAARQTGQPGTAQGPLEPRQSASIEPRVIILPGSYYPASAPRGPAGRVGTEAAKTPADSYGREAASPAGDSRTLPSSPPTSRRVVLAIRARARCRMPHRSRQSPTRARKSGLRSRPSRATSRTSSNSIP